MKVLISIFLILNHFSTYGQVFVNSEYVWQDRCNYKLFSNMKLIKLDCSDTSIHNFFTQWPVETLEATSIHASFKNNNITTLKEIPSTNATLKLVLSYCNIKYLNTGLFRSTINVKYVDLSHNLLQSDQLGADVFKGPYNDTYNRPISLEYLNLAYNLLHSLQQDVFEYTPNLKVLNLEGNQFRILDRVTTISFKNIPNLQTLNLAKNHLTEIRLDAVKYFKNLEDINLAFNSLDFIPVSLNSVNKTLQKLNVSGNSIIELNDESFNGLENVLKLYANDLTQLELVKESTFTNLKNLQVLQLSGNHKLLEIDQNAFGDTTSIKELYLEDNSLYHISRKLLPWSQLTIFELKGNRLYCDCDLYNITHQLLIEIQKRINTLHCTDIKNFISKEVINLKGDDCQTEIFGKEYSVTGLQKSISKMRIVLSLMMVFLVISTALVIWLGITKWNAYKRSINYPFPNQIVYNTLYSSDVKY